MESNTARHEYQPLSSLLVMIVAGCLISAIGLGVRSIYGLFLEPISDAREWSRDVFSLAMALQYLFWGLGLPIAGAFADRFGPVWVLVFGGLIYGAGSWAMAIITDPLWFQIVGGVLVGFTFEDTQGFHCAGGNGQGRTAGKTFHDPRNRNSRRFLRHVCILTDQSIFHRSVRMEYGADLSCDHCHAHYSLVFRTAPKSWLNF